MRHWFLAGALGLALWFLPTDWRPVGYAMAAGLCLFLFAFIQWGDEKAGVDRPRLGSLRLFFAMVSGAYGILAAITAMPSVSTGL